MIFIVDLNRDLNRLIEIMSTLNHGDINQS